MDKPTDGNNGDRPSGSGGDTPKRDFAYAESMRARLSAMQQELQRDNEILVKLAAPYKEESERNITRLVGDKQDLLMWVSGATPQKTIGQGTILSSQLAGLNGRVLEPRSFEAIVDQMRSMARTSGLITLMADGIILGAAFRRWRRSPRRVSTNVFVRYTWPMMLVLGYSVPMKVFVEPIVQIGNTRYQMTQFRRDPRISNLNLDMRGYLEKAHRAEKEGRSDDAPSSTDTSETAPGSSSTSWEQTTSSSASWERPEPQSKIQSQTPSDAWSGADDIDDASPVAPSSKSNSDQSGGSAWDRLRHEQQSASQQRQRQPTQQRAPPPASGWESQEPAQRPSETPEWGSAEPVQSYTPPPATDDYEKPSAKDQAQREFDRLVERERRGIDQENDRWRRS